MNEKTILQFRNAFKVVRFVLHIFIYKILVSSRLKLKNSLKISNIYSI